jgi:hypothetical protein
MDILGDVRKFEKKGGVGETLEKWGLVAAVLALPQRGS